MLQFAARVAVLGAAMQFFVSSAVSAPATLAKTSDLEVISRGTRIGSRAYPIGTRLDASTAENGKVHVTVEDGATALLPSNAVVFDPPATPKPVVPLPVARSGSTPAAVPATDLSTLSGKTYKQARVFRVEPDGISYMFASGMVKIPFGDLPETLREQYGYDPEKARHFAEQDAADQQQTAATQAADLDAYQNNKKTEEALNKSQFFMSAKVRQLTDKGALVDGSLAELVVRSRTVDTSTLLESRSEVQKYKDLEMTPLKDPVFVYNIGDGLVDGDAWAGKVWLVGTYRYETVMGASKTVRAFSANRQEAAKLLREKTR